jgi:hypothetical protein
MKTFFFCFKEGDILILGENGVGKELIANVLHYNSACADGPFIKFNCAALPESLIESELFGHVSHRNSQIIDQSPKLSWMGLSCIIYAVFWYPIELFMNCFTIPINSRPENAIKSEPFKDCQVDRKITEYLFP